MNVITLASRKGGVGKSTLTAHLAAYAHLTGRRCMVVDADPQGSLTLWHSMRTDNGLVLQNAAQGINRLVASALLNGYQWMFIDTAPKTWLVVQEGSALRPWWSFRCARDFSISPPSARRSRPRASSTSPMRW